MNFTSPIDMTLRTKCGQSFTLVAGVPTYISPQAEIEAIAAGLTPNSPTPPAFAAAVAAAATTASAAATSEASAETAQAAAADAVAAEEAAAP